MMGMVYHLAGALVLRDDATDDPSWEIIAITRCRCWR